jgi:hypothetical protein
MPVTPRTGPSERRRDRWSFGLYAANLAGTGLTNVSDWRMKPGVRLIPGMFRSGGRSAGACISRAYATSVSVLRFTGSNGLSVETYPQTRRFGVSAVLNVWRTASVLVDAERTTGDAYREYRLLAGLRYRF